MPVKATRSEHLLILKGNCWWFRQGVPKPVRKVTSGPAFIMINLETSDIREADRMQAGLGKLEQAMFTSALADRASYSRVDVDAPLIPAAAE